jgi:hypothetical protein
MIGDASTPVAGPAESAQPVTAAASVDPVNPIGPFQMSEDDLLRQLGEWWRESTGARREVRPKRTKDWQYYAGDQWEKADADRAKEQKRPALTLNMLLSIISAVEGEERTNRQEIKFYGEGQEDDGSAFGINRICKWIMDQCGGQFALSKQFRSGVICGEGWIVPEVDYFDDPNGKIKLICVDDEECFPDPLDFSEDGADARYFNRVRMMTAEEGNARWPGFTEKVQQQSIAQNVGPERDGSGARDIYSIDNDLTSPKLFDAQKKLWAVIETWWSQIEPGWVMVDEATGLLVEKSDADFQEMKAQREQEQADWLRQLLVPPPAPPQMTDLAAPDAPAAPMMAPSPIMGHNGGPPMQPAIPPRPPALQAVERPIRRFYQAFHTFGTLLDRQPSALPTMKRFPYVPFRGLFDKVKKDWFGIARPILDPQRQHNVEQSAIVQLMQLMPKASWMAPKGAYHDKTKWQEQVAQPGAMLEYNAQRGKPEQISTPAVPRHLIDMASERPGMMQAISGVNSDLMGVRVAGDPGITMEMRQKAARTVLAPIFDNYRQTKMALGKVLLAYIQQYITPGRRMRVLDGEDAAFVEMTLDMQLGDYDLTVDETDDSVNDRIATLNIMQTTLPALAKTGVPIPPEIIDLMPMDPKIRTAWKRQMMWTMQLAGQLPPPGWKEGDPVPAPAPPPGMPPQAAPAPAPVQ